MVENVGCSENNQCCSTVIHLLRLWQQFVEIRVSFSTAKAAASWKVTELSFGARCLFVGIEVCSD